MKKKILILASILLSFCAVAKEGFFYGDDYCISANYNELAKPGDAVFVKLDFSQSNKKGKISKTEFSKTKATLELIVDGKKVRSSEFFVISKNTKTSKTLLAGIPLSTWWTQDSKCVLKIIYSIDNKKTLEFELPFALEQKEFICETLDLDQANTNIKTDSSAKRMEQIKKLNDILATINSSDIFQTTTFVPPTTSTRRTAFFADRREYKYTTGKSSTSLHYGTDYGIPEGTNVTACAEGKVVLAENRITTGYSVVIEHLPGLYSLYYHLSQLKVKEGDIVKSGQLIGLSGSTGLATGPHLHWEMRLNCEAVNPDFFTTNFAFTE